jgi:trk system potassium uptake protein TrkH
MLIGGCAGSTSGGVKVVRLLIILKRITYHFKRLIHPSLVRPLKYNQTVITNDQQNSILSFFLIYLLLFFIGTFIMSVIGLDLKTAAGSIITTMGGIGPGFGEVGPAGNFAGIPIFGKLFLSFYMILGRLEILSVLVIFSPGFWRI